MNTSHTRQLAHLLRRASFGARPDEWTEYARLDVTAVTDRLLHPEHIPDHLNDVLRDIGGDFVDFDNLDSVRGWWVYRMAHSQRPLEEKMTLFWHNHFATAVYKVGNPHWMWQQNQLFRANALGNFRTLLHAVSRDPAMLVWLDGAENRKGKPNENFGRELLELFTMGVGSGYTETDVKEAARAFTGWQFDRDSSTFVFNAGEHDDGPKTFLGETGHFTGDDVIDIIVRQPATARFLCAKLFRFFVHDAPTDADLAPFTRVYFASGYDIRAVVGAMLKSPAFYSDQSYYAKIKSPTEFVVITLRTLDIPLALAGGGLPGTLREMGQDLFNPPNVKGWPEGQTWINTRTMQHRVNFVMNVIGEMERRGLVASRLHRSLLEVGGVRPTALPAPVQLVDALWATYLPGHTPTAKTRDTLVAYTQNGLSSHQSPLDSKGTTLLSLILAAPEYHLA